MLVPPACSGCKQPARQNTKKHRTSTLLVDDQMLSLRHACCDYNVQISTLGLSVTPAWHTHSSGWLLILRLHSQPYGTPQAPHAGTFVLSPHTSTAHLSCWPFQACCPPGGQGPLTGGQAPHAGTLDESMRSDGKMRRGDKLVLSVGVLIEQTGSVVVRSERNPTGPPLGVYRTLAQTSTAGNQRACTQEATFICATTVSP